MADSRESEGSPAQSIQQQSLTDPDVVMSEPLSSQGPQASSKQPQASSEEPQDPQEPVVKPREKLRRVYRVPFWDNESGLITSPYEKTYPKIPNWLAWNPKTPTTRARLSDDEIYLAFYPIAFATEGALLECLDVTDSDLEFRIISSGDGWSLEPGLIKSWSSLEDTLITLSLWLLVKNKHYDQFPRLTFPSWPRDFRYRETQPSLGLAHHCACQARDAFNILSTFFTFTLSLWLHSDYVDECFDEALDCLRQSKLVQKLKKDEQEALLLNLQRSVIFDLSPGLRIGAFMNPYATRWRGGYTYFTKANVPFWFLWGHGENAPEPDPYMKSWYYPPAELIEKAKAVAKRNVGDLLYHPLPPTLGLSPAGYEVYPDNQIEPDPFPSSEVSYEEVGPTRDIDLPPPSPPPVERRAVVDAKSGQRPYEQWEEFCQRMKKEEERFLRNETPSARKSREDRTRASLERGRTKKSRVFVWEADEVDASFWRRKEIKGPESKQKAWASARRWQRHYWSHCDTWDLCLWIKAAPEDYVFSSTWDPAEDTDSDSDTHSDIYPADAHYADLPPPSPSRNKPGASNPSVQDFPVVAVGKHVMSSPELNKLATRDASNAAANVVQQIAAQYPIRPSQWSYPFHSLVRHIYLRYGFDVENPVTIARDLERAKVANFDNQFLLAVKRLLYTEKDQSLLPTTNYNIQLAIVHFAGANVPKQLNYDVLYAPMKAAWDVCSQRLLNNPGLRVQKVSCVSSDVKNESLYIIRPFAESPPWYVATTSATIVLLAYRSNWTTSRAIAEGLLKLGVKFNTVEERDRKAAEAEGGWPARSVGLGSRPPRFEPTKGDYEAYLATRSHLLSGKRGRAIRLAGGLAGRIAAGEVSVERVLEGPAFGDAVIGVSDDKEYIDDAIPLDDLEVLCGVYYVKKEAGHGRPSEQSWWPRHLTWFATHGRSDVQWQPEAEDWYMLRLQQFSAGKYNLHKASDWRKNSKYFRVPTRAIRNANEKIAADYIERCLLLGRD